MFSRKPTVITTHSNPTAKIYLFWDLFRSIPIMICDCVVATTEMEKQHLIQRGVKSENIRVIPPNRVVSNRHPRGQSFWSANGYNRSRRFT